MHLNRSSLRMQARAYRHTGMSKNAICSTRLLRDLHQEEPPNPTAYFLLLLLFPTASSTTTIAIILTSPTLPSAGSRRAPLYIERTAIVRREFRFGGGIGT